MTMNCIFQLKCMSCVAYFFYHQRTSAWFHGYLLVRLSNNAQWSQPTIYSELKIKCTMLVMANPFFFSHEIFNISSICLLFINAQLRFGTFYKRVFFSSKDTQSKKYNNPISFRIIYNCFKLNFRTKYRPLQLIWVVVNEWSLCFVFSDTPTNGTARLDDVTRTKQPFC